MLKPTCDLTYRTPQMSLGRLSQLLAYLKSEKVFKLKCSVGCGDREFIRQIDMVLKKKGNTSRNYYDGMLTVPESSLSLAKSGVYKKVIDLSNNMSALIFVNEYRDMLRRLGEEFKLSLIWENNIIKVHSADPISPVFQSQILGMKLKLQYAILNDRDFYLKAQMSKYMHEKLLKMNIKILLLSSTKAVVLHSSDVNHQRMKQAATAFYYDALIITFYSKIVSYRVNRRYFNMLMYLCRPKLKQISQNYEIKVEVNQHRYGIIMHTRDPIFAAEPRNELTTFISGILFITYHSDHTKDDFHYITAKRRGANFLRVLITDKFVYTCWNTEADIDHKFIEEAYGKLLQSWYSNSVLRIGFNNQVTSPQLNARVQYLAAKYKLDCEYHGEDAATASIVYVRFRTFNKHERQYKTKYLSLFLQELITGMAELDQIQSVQQLEYESNRSVSSLEADNASCCGSSDASREPSSPLVAETEAQALEFEFQSPEIVIAENFNCKKGRRNKKMQQLLQESFNIVARVWNLVVESPVYIGGRERKTPTCKISPVLKFEFQNQIKVREPVFVDFTRLESDVEYYLVSELSNPEEFVLTHKIIVYGSY